MDQNKLFQSLDGKYFDGVIHLQQIISCESVHRPEVYYRNNVTGTLNLVNAMQRIGVNNLVFSSTAAIFGKL